MKLINWIKRKLLLHTPLWVCVLLALAAIGLLTDSASFLVLIFLFFAYFLARHLWRKHLKKGGKLGKESSGLFSLIFWGAIGVFWAYASLTPDSPRLVLYETSEPAVYDSIDSFPSEKIIGESDEAGNSSRTRKAKKGFLRGALFYVANSVRDGAFACAFIQQKKLIHQCEAVPKEVRRVELDSDAATVELLMSDKKSEDCVETACNVWLIQATQAQITHFNDAKKDNEEVKKPPPVAEATLIDQWVNIVTPVIVFNEVSNGWRHIQITDASGNVKTWIEY